MCTRPILINTKSTVFEGLNDARQHPSTGLLALKFVKNSGVAHYGDLLRPYKRNVALVSCGKCIECLKKRQNDLAIRCYREAQKYGSMTFLTLTYSDDTLPLSISLRRVWTEDGQIDVLSPPEIIHDDHRDGRLVEDDTLRSRILSLPAGVHSREVVVDLFEEDGLLYQYVVTPSLCVRDVQLWLKSARVAYEREFHVKLDFSYVLCGEYGPKTCRPHYHLGCFGLSLHQAQWMAKRWSDSLGYTYTERVSAVNEDGTNGFELASRYIAKYMTKGNFECDSVKCKTAIKPRLCVSLHLGALDDKLISYYRGYDVYGKYDIDSLRLSDGCLLSRDQIDYLLKIVQSRSKFSINGFSYSLPTVFKKSIWYVPNEFKKGSCRPSSLRVISSSSQSSNPLQDYIRSLRSDNSFRLSQREMDNLVFAFVRNSFVDSQDLQSVDFASLRRFYSSSIF